MPTIIISQLQDNAGVHSPQGVTVTNHTCWPASDTITTSTSPSWVVRGIVI